MGRSPCCIKEGLKKGPWTQEEDQKLIAYVKEHGHGNWRSLPKKCGLLRCGKSCRLRWTNYLRPDIKRGFFTPTEEQKIIQLHSLVGNKWAFIASQLPRRTDNEIKNYWNTVLKKRQEKLGLLSFGPMPLRTSSTLGTGAAADRQQRLQDTKGDVKSSASMKLPSCSSHGDMQSSAFSSPASTHLAQWESARLEAEARLSKQSPSSKPHKLPSFTHLGHTISASNAVTTAASNALSPLSLYNPHSNVLKLNQLANIFSNPLHAFPSGVPNTCLVHHHPTINSLSTTSGLSLPGIAPMPCSCPASDTSSASSNMVSCKSLSSLSSQESIASDVTLVPRRRLSWQAKELSISPSPNISSASQSSFISQMLCKIDKDHGHEVEVNAELKEKRGNEQMSLQEATSSIMDLNSTIMESSVDLNSTMDNWHELIFDVENSCSDMASTNWKDPIVSSSQMDEFTHDSTSNNTQKSVSLEFAHTVPHAAASKGQDIKYSSMQDLEGLNLIHFDSLISWEQDIGDQQSKELLWDTPPTLSVSSALIVT